jgi:cell fate (sporulation/competence/biofilm development) regulator YmcA (YheA/YmcA/DUF963 family)
MTISKNSPVAKKIEKKESSKKNMTALEIIEKKKELSQIKVADRATNEEGNHRPIIGNFTHSTSNRGK